MNLCTEILKASDHLRTAQQELFDAQRNHDVDLPSEIAAAETAALSGDREALQDLVLLRERLTLLPGVIVRLRSKADRLEETVRDLGRELLSEIRDAARERLEQIQLDFMSQQDVLFGGSVTRTRDALKAVIVNCEARRWRDELPRDLSSYGSAENLAPRLIYLREAFEGGKSLSMGFKETQKLGAS